MKIAVTGANGFLGRHILNELNAVSVNVIATTLGDVTIMTPTQISKAQKLAAKWKPTEK